MTPEEDTHDDRIAALEAQISDLQARNEQLEGQVEALETTVEELQSENAALEEQTTTLRERVQSLETQPDIRIADENDPIGSLHIAGAPVGQAITSKPGQTDLDAELDELREELQAYVEGDAHSTEPTINPETPLEQVVAMPEAMVEAQLTANQQRARFVAKDITEYATKTPAGWVLTPKDLRTVLNAAFDTGHSQTCSRVRAILADLGGEHVEIKDSRGEKKLVVDGSLVGRVAELQTTDHDVVSPSEV